VGLTCLLDTDVAIEILRQRDSELTAKVRGRDDLGVSMITAFELTRGGLKSGRPDYERSIAAFLLAAQPLDFDLAAAGHAADIRVDLERVGTPIGPYDTLIAGHARSRGLVLVTRNVRAFERVPGLRVERW